MTLPSFNRTQAILWGGFAAGFIELMAIFVIWQVFENVPPLVILQAVATAFMGNDAYQAGAQSALLGLVLHFFVSFCFAAAYVTVSGYVSPLRKYPFIFGPLYGIVAYLVMTYIVVPISLATFGRPDTLFSLARSVLMHMFIFAPPIALAASRIRASR
ncbi:MAG TPA: hypothetical protein VFX02_01250 [Gammaproteobacteria bacterium]|nr:hypothetical protein [Gammaproteobacteria bacterium]